MQQNLFENKNNSTDIQSDGRNRTQTIELKRCTRIFKKIQSLKMIFCKTEELRGGGGFYKKVPIFPTKAFLSVKTTILEVFYGLYYLTCTQ